MAGGIQSGTPLRAVCVCGSMGWEGASQRLNGMKNEKKVERGAGSPHPPGSAQVHEI
jgi:hypothetical protein